MESTIGDTAWAKAREDAAKAGFELSKACSKTPACAIVRSRTWRLRGRPTRFTGDGFYRESHSIASAYSFAPPSSTRLTPRQILREVRTLEAMAAWARARLAGIERSHEEMIKQQHKYVEALEAQDTLHNLSQGKSQ